MNLPRSLLYSFIESGLALLPLILFFILFQKLVLRLPREYTSKVIRGLILTAAGLTLFLHGVYVGLMPAGREFGVNIISSIRPWLLIPIGFVVGLAATVAEPAVRILGHQVEHTSGGYIRQIVIVWTLAIGVAVLVSLGMVRLLWGFNLLYLIVPGYVIALVLSRFVSREFVAIAFDSGAVATGPMTITFVMALAVGASTAIAGRQPLIDGFGLIALVALAPVLSVMLLGLVYHRQER